jgi:hypothetical protein
MTAMERIALRPKLAVNCLIAHASQSDPLPPFEQERSGRLGTLRHCAERVAERRYQHARLVAEVTMDRDCEFRSLEPIALMVSGDRLAESEPRHAM